MPGVGQAFAERRVIWEYMRDRFIINLTHLYRVVEIRVRESFDNTLLTRHKSHEMADKNDIRASIDLLKVCLVELDQYDWKF